MRLLQINVSSTEGSTGRTCREFSDYVNGCSGHTCYTAYSTGGEIENGYKMGHELGKKAHAFLSRITGLQAHFSTLSTWKMLRWVDGIRPDAVIRRNVHSNFLNLPLVLRYLAERDIPTVVVLDDCWYFTGKCTHYTLSGCYRWQSGCHDCPRLRKDIPSWFFDRTPEMWQEKRRLFSAVPRLGVVGVSEWVSSEARESILANSLCITSIYNWVDLSVFKPVAQAREGLPDIPFDFVVLGVASSWGAAKGLSSFIELASRLRRDECIVLVGSLPSGIDLPPNVISVGPVNSESVLAQYYSAADILLSLSAEETFGKVSAEALACGTPIVCMDSTASPELCGEGCGFVCPVGNLDAVAVALRKVRAAGGEEYRERCVAFARQTFAKEGLIERWLAFVESLASGASETGSIEK